MNNKHSTYPPTEGLSRQVADPNLHAKAAGCMRPMALLSRHLVEGLFLAMLLSGLLPGKLLAQLAPEVTFTRLHSFGDPLTDTVNPEGRLTEGSDGGLYGTTVQGGAGYGTVFRVNKDGSGFTVLKTINGGADGRYPQAGVTEGSDGRWYGTSQQGGDANIGTVFALEITAPNQAPTEISLSDQWVPEDAPLDTPVGIFSTADADADDTHTYELVSGEGDADNGAFTIDGDQLHTAVIFDYEAKSSYSIRVRATDAGGLWVEQSFVIEVGNVNEAPVAWATYISALEDATVVVTLQGSDPDGDPLNFTVLEGPTHGVLSGTAPNLTYTPAPNFFGSDSFTFTVGDGQATSEPAAVVINLSPVNDPPVIANQSLKLAENSPYGITIGFVQASDPDTGDVLDYRITGASVSGVFGISTSNGELSIINNAPLDYETTPQFTLSVRMTDLAGATASATVTIQLTDVNEVPLANAQSISTAEDTAVAVTLSGSDPESAVLQYTVLSQPTRGSLTGTVPNLTYTPFFGLNGPDSFSFTVSDGTLTSAPATVSLSVTPVNDFPEAFAQTVVTAEDTPVSIALGASDPEAGGYTVLHTLTGTDGKESYGQLIEDDAGFLYGTTRLGGTFNRGVVFRVAKDGTGYTVLRAFGGTDGDQPSSGLFRGSDGFLYGTTVQGGTGLEGVVYKISADGLQFAVIQNFTFPNGSDFTVLHALPADGSQGLYLSAGVLEGDQQQWFGVAEAGGSAGAGILFRIQHDGSGYTVLHEFGVEAGDGQSPTGNLMVGPDGALYGTTFGGGETGLGTIYRIGQDGSGYRVLRSFTNAYPDTGNPDFGSLALGPDGMLYGTARAGGDFGAVYRISPSGATYERLHVFRVNSGDGIQPRTGLHVDADGVVFGTTSRGGPLDQGTIFRIDPAAGGITSFIVSGQPLSGTLGGTPPNVIYTPAANFNGTDRFFFQVSDGSLSTSVQVSIVVKPVNDLPVANAQLLETYDNESLAITLSGTDTEAGQLEYRIVAGPEVGTLSGTPPEVVYAPPFPYAGTDQFTFEVEDAAGGTATAMVEITILASDRPPVAVAGDDQTVLANVNCTATVTVDGSGSSDPDGDPIEFAWELFEDGELLDTRLGGATVAWELPIGTYEASLTVITEVAGNLVASTDSLIIQVLPSEPVLDALEPAAAYANGPGFDLTVTGGCFLEGATVYWNGAPRATTRLGPSQLVAAIPASDLQTGVDVFVATVQVVNGDGQVSDALGFSIVAQTVGTVEATVSQPGKTSTVSTAPQTAGKPGATVSVENGGDEPVTVLTASYDERPVGETVFQVDNGAFVDVQITGEPETFEQVSATVFFYYPSTITGGMENRVKLRYFNGVDWIPVLSSGGLPPAKDTTDNLDGTVSGGRFAVVFDMTSTPTVLELGGTVFGMFESEPQLGEITGPTGPLALGNALNVGASFAVVGDPAGVDVRFLWDDGTETFIEPQIPGQAEASHIYSAPGVYGVTIQVTDSEGDTRSGRFEYAVIYDPNGGFVTGGGWIQSPPGAYLFDPTLFGKATFGFVSKYKKGQSVPTGQTQFQFQAAEFGFQSTAYEWLVVSGAKAQYKGVGKVNNAGDYGFLLTATDGQVKGGGGIDKFRIKIWDRASDMVVYDNLMGQSDNLNTANPQVLGGGSIVIHQAK